MDTAKAASKAQLTQQDEATKREAQAAARAAEAVARSTEVAQNHGAASPAKGPPPGARTGSRPIIVDYKFTGVPDTSVSQWVAEEICTAIKSLGSFPKSKCVQCEVG